MPHARTNPPPAMPMQPSLHGAGSQPPAIARSSSYPPPPPHSYHHNARSYSSGYYHSQPHARGPPPPALHPSYSYDHYDAPMMERMPVPHMPSASAEVYRGGACTCKKSKCLKLYCQCFASSATCGGRCKCLECKNTSGYSDEIEEARKAILERNPAAFEDKFPMRYPSMPPPRYAYATGPPAPRHHPMTAPPPHHAPTAFGRNPYATDTTRVNKLGCKCRKSFCLKKYCECFQNSSHCGWNCRCANCKNLPPGVTARARGMGYVYHHSPSSRNYAAAPPPMPLYHGPPPPMRHLTHGPPHMPIPPSQSWDHSEGREYVRRAPELRRQGSNLSAPVESVVIYRSVAHEELSDQEDEEDMLSEKDESVPKEEERTLSEKEETRDPGDAMAIMAAVAMAELAGKQVPESPTPNAKSLTQISPTSTTVEVKVDGEFTQKRKAGTTSRLPFKKRRSSTEQDHIEQKAYGPKVEENSESRNPSPANAAREDNVETNSGTPRRVSPTPNPTREAFTEKSTKKESPSKQYHHLPHPHDYHGLAPRYESPSSFSQYPEHAYVASRGPPPPPPYYRHPSSTSPRYHPPHYTAPLLPHHYQQTRSPRSMGSVPVSPQKNYERGMHEELSPKSGLPRSLSFRKICSRCGKTRAEHGELGFGNKCVFEECGKCLAGLHVHQIAGQPMGILCHLTVAQGAKPGATEAYEHSLKGLASRANLQREIRRRTEEEHEQALNSSRREAPATA